MKMTDELRFERLFHPGDYKETAVLIYNTDPYIYRDLFGSVENACRVLAFSFENERCVFHRDEIYLIKNGRDEVIGCTLNASEGMRWDRDAILSDFERAEVEPTAAFFSASDYMEKTYNYRKLGKNICNVSVKEDCRGRGVASFLLYNLFKLCDRGVFELTVLEDNTAAIRLYEKFGFRIIGNAFDDYGGHGLPPVRCYRMVHNGNPD